MGMAATSPQAARVVEYRRRANVEDWLSVEQAAERLGVPPRTVRRWIKLRHLAAIDTGIKTGTGTIHLIPAAALAGFVRPRMGRPRKAEAQE